MNGGYTAYCRRIPDLNIGYARVSTNQQDLTAQRDGLQALGVPADRLYVDHGLTGTNRERPGLHQALAACRDGDTARRHEARPTRALAARRPRDHLPSAEAYWQLFSTSYGPTKTFAEVLGERREELKRAW